MGETVAAFLRYAASRLHPLGVRVSADVFGLSATNDLGIGQTPGQIGEVVDTIYPMTYPSHYASGEFNLPDPNAAPGKTVADSLRDFRIKLAGTKAQLVPWLQDFSLGRRYTAADVAAQVQAARHVRHGRIHALERGRDLHEEGARPQARRRRCPRCTRRISRLGRRLYADYSSMQSDILSPWP